MIFLNNPISINDELMYKRPRESCVSTKSVVRTFLCGSEEYFLCFLMVKK